MSKIIPNSFQTPNAYVDEFMALLTPEEYVVLSYAARRILGFHKESDHISLSQFSEGIERNGTRLDYGTGLSKPAVRRALDALMTFGMIVQVAPYVKETSTPALFALQLDYEQVDRAGLERRRDERHARDAQRTKAGRSVTHPIQSDNTPPIQSDLSDPPVQSDRTPLVSATVTPLCSGTEQQKTEEKQRGNKETKSHSRVEAASSPPPVKKVSTSEQAREIFAYWQEVHEHPHAILDDKRRRAIESRLKEGATVDFIKQAIRGIKRSKYHMGQNDRHKVYDGIGLICRDAEHLEGFAALDVVKIKQERAESPPRACRFCVDGMETIVDRKTGADIQVPCSRCGGRKAVGR